MKNLVKIGIYSYIFLYSFVIFAQGDEDGNGDLEGNDPPPVPINTKLIYLGIIAVFFAIYIYKRRRKVA